MSLKDFIFHIVSADEYTLVYIEHHPEHFGQANVAAIMEKVRCALKNRMVEFMGSSAPVCHDVDKWDTIGEVRIMPPSVAAEPEFHRHENPRHEAEMAAKSHG
ncbi:hypothetical protein M5D96_011653 [Drosophila gunungcola]|uniref:Uncharacterized protein n=2 Tax=Drosophila gunungcola TaxID=103775 RepID=A0A9P9YEM2_9MUSC|nr:hypothetical protein M5D96_011653 [Drosophila gunungcola]